VLRRLIFDIEHLHNSDPSLEPALLFFSSQLFDSDPKLSQCHYKARQRVRLGYPS
jgi:hypothetical protein